MKSSNLVLRNLRMEDESSFRSAIKEFLASDDGHIFAFNWNDDCDFKEYIKLVEGWEHGENLEEGFVTASYFIGVENGKVVGRISLRHKLNDFLERIGGHIGYCVIPSEENNGYATEMLRQSLEVCRKLKIFKVLLTCDLDNIASKKVIEKCGGIFEGITNCPELEKQKRRYWFQLNSHSDPVAGGDRPR